MTPRVIFFNTVRGRAAVRATLVHTQDRGASVRTRNAGQRRCAVLSSRQCQCQYHVRHSQWAAGRRAGRRTWSVRAEDDVSCQCTHGSACGGRQRAREGVPSYRWTRTSLRMSLCHPSCTRSVLRVRPTNCAPPPCLRRCHQTRLSTACCTPLPPRSWLFVFTMTCRAHTSR